MPSMTVAAPLERGLDLTDWSEDAAGPAVREGPHHLTDWTEGVGSGRRQIRVSRDPLLLAVCLLVLATNQMVAADVYVSWLSPAMGALCVLAVPTFLLYGARIIPARGPGERLAVSAVLTLLGLMVGGLVVNTVLPWLGIGDPLGQVPTLVTIDFLLLGLGLWARPRHPATYVITTPVLGRADAVVLGLGSLTLALAIMGAVRLNNGAGGGMTLVMLIVALVETGLVLAWRDRLHPGVVSLVVYGLSLALLLMTSLRGWHTTGHDVQQEFRVFQLTKTNGNWSMARFRDPYNACLSITILPTIIGHWTRVDDPYVYKVFFQLLFALCPVLLFNLARRMVSLVFALLATLYFITFVTFFQDMPMLNRQEVAFLFLAAALLIFFNDGLAIAARRRWACVFAAGMVLSHYSTTYVAVGVFGLAWLIGVIAPRLVRLARPAVPRLAGRVTAALGHGRHRVLTLGPVLFMGVLAAVWSGPVTHTEAGLTKTATAAIDGLRGGSSGSKSSDTSYSIFSLHRAAPAEQLAKYQAAGVAATAADRAAGDYYPNGLVSRYPTPVAADAKLPLTSAGRALSKVGVDVAAFNYVIRQAAARILQILAVLGLVVVLFAKRKLVQPPPEFVMLAIGSMLIVLLQVVLPVLSVNYGLLRAFQQALLVLNVFMVAGSLALLPRRAGRWRTAAASLLVLVLFASSTGVFTQLLGGYGPQLHLNNAGTYYDIYYLHPEEIAAAAWLRTKTSLVAPEDLQADQFTFERIQTLVPLYTPDDIDPSLVRVDEYVYLGFSNVTKQESTISYSGDLITYRYPLAFLDENKDLVYSTGGSRVYR